MSLNRLEPLLKDEIINTKSEEELKKTFYSVYENDFLKNPFKINGKDIKIVPDKSKIPGFEEYQETFAHIVTREIKSQKERFFELNRANRIHWVKQILLCYPCKDVKYFKWTDERGECKEYFWYLSGNFMVVLKDISDKLKVVTAFCIDNDERLKFFEWNRLYEEGKSVCK